MALRNTKVKTTTTNAIMRSKAFAAGVEDALLGVRYDDVWPTQGMAYEYEYGRLWQKTTKESRVRQKKGWVDEDQQRSFDLAYGREIPLDLRHLPTADELGL